MTRLITSVSVVCLATMLSAQQAPLVFRSTRNTVPLFVTVSDKSEHLVTNLEQRDFEVRDNGKVQPIILFDNSPQPIRLIVMLDVSGSMYGNLPLLQSACDALFAKLRPDDQVRVGAFGKTISIAPSFSSNPSELRAEVPQIIEPDAGTPLWESMDRAIKTFDQRDDGRRVVLVMSDGGDSGLAGKFGGHLYTELEIIDKARAADVMIYGVGFRSRGRAQPIGVGAQAVMQAITEGMPDPKLGAVALATGGGYFESRSQDDLNSSFARVADELHAQYLLGFVPPTLDGKKHSLDVRITTRDAKPRTRKDYVAPKE